MQLDSVAKSYARWAPIYDQTFGGVTRAGRREAVRRIDARPGDVLEIGVGTGLALPLYRGDVRVTGIDYSDEMLKKARERARGLSRIRELRQMDARELDFPDASFDTVAAMHVLSVVPEPGRVMAEIARVLRPGGQVVVTNHFRADKGPLRAAAEVLAPFADRIGWHADFGPEAIATEPALREVERRPLPPFGMMTLLVLEKA